MTLWLLDASVFLAGEDSGDSQHVHALRLLRSDDTLATLDLAYYETANVAVRAWRDEASAIRMREQITAVAGDGGVVRIDALLLTAAQSVAAQHGISVYDSAYVAAARERGGRLISCDVRDLVSRRLALLPADVPVGPSR